MYEWRESCGRRRRLNKGTLFCHCTGVLRCKRCAEEILSSIDFYGSEMVITAFANIPDNVEQQCAIRETVKIIDAEDVPLQYYPGNTARVKVKAAGDLA